MYCDVTLTYCVFWLTIILFNFFFTVNSTGLIIISRNKIANSGLKFIMSQRGKMVLLYAGYIYTRAVQRRNVVIVGCRCDTVTNEKYKW